MNDERLALLADLNQKYKEREEIKREKHRMNMRRKELYRRATQKNLMQDPKVKEILMRYALDIKKRTDQINQLNEQIFAMENGW